MPNYSYTITTAAGRTAANPVETDLAISYGVIHFIGIWVPGGSQGEAHVVLYHGRDRVAPTNPEEDYHGDKDYFPIRDFYEITTGPASLKAVTWNDSATRDRECQIHIQVLARDLLLPTEQLTLALLAFLRRLRVPLPWVGATS